MAGRRKRRVSVVSGLALELSTLAGILFIAQPSWMGSLPGWSDGVLQPVEAATPDAEHRSSEQQSLADKYDSLAKSLRPQISGDVAFGWQDASLIPQHNPQSFRPLYPEGQTDTVEHSYSTRSDADVMSTTSWRAAPQNSSVSGNSDGWGRTQAAGREFEAQSAMPLVEPFARLARMPRTAFAPRVAPPRFQFPAAYRAAAPQPGASSGFQGY